jgi:hypothetical protein
LLRLLLTIMRHCVCDVHGTGKWAITKQQANVKDENARGKSDHQNVEVNERFSLSTKGDLEAQVDYLG